MMLWRIDEARRRAASTAFASAVVLLLLAQVPAVRAHGAGPDTYREAYDLGYEEGLKAGREDREEGRLFDFANKRIYQTGGAVDPPPGQREVFLVAFRRGFEDGYEVGYGLSRRPAEAPAVPAAPAPVRRTADVPPASPLGSLSVPVGELVRIRLVDSLSTEANQRGDAFRAEVIEDVRVNDTLAIPRGARVNGTVSHLKRAGRVAGRAELNLRFETLEFPNGTLVPFDAVLVAINDRGDDEVDPREGSVEARGTKGEDLRRVGTASAIGALIGVISRGKKGGAVGAGAGAGVGLAGVLASRGREIELFSQTELTVRTSQEVLVPERARR